MAQSTYVRNSILFAMLLSACGGGGLVPGGPTDESGTGGGDATGGTDSCGPGTAGEGGAGGEGGASALTTVERYGHLRLDGTSLVSEDGEPIQLKGASSMWLNWETEGYARNLSGVQYMRDRWGLQIIRAAMGVEVDSGYAAGNQAGMVAQVNQIVENAETLGIYVIVDFHSHEALDYQDEAITFFSDISARYGHLPNLILEPFNEPTTQDWSTELKPYHEAVLAAIRENDPDDHPNIAVLGVPYWDQNVDNVIGDEVDDDYVMYAVHFYSCTHGSSFRNKAMTAHAAGIPIFITEWGATTADGGVDGTPACEPEADQWLNWLDQEKISWTAWKLDNCAHEAVTNGIEDTSCFFKANATTVGGWTEADYNGHAPYVISRMGGCL